MNTLDPKAKELIGIYYNSGAWDGTWRDLLERLRRFRAIGNRSLVMHRLYSVHDTKRRFLLEDALERSKTEKQVFTTVYLFHNDRLYLVHKRD